jgi:hypothetical protein
MAGNITRRVGTWTQLLSTELNALANNAGGLQVVGTNAAFDNTTGLWFWGDFEAIFTFGTAPTAGANLDLYLLPLCSDGTTYADGAGGTTPTTVAAHYKLSFPVRAVTTAQRVVVTDVPIPGGQFLVLLVNNTTGQALAATGHTVKMRPQGEAYT